MPLRNPINFEEAYNQIPELLTFLTESPSEEAIRKAANIAVVNSIHTQKTYSDFKHTNSEVRMIFANETAKGNFPDEVDIIRNLHIPVFVLQGDKDPIINLNYMKRLREEEGLPLQITIMENCSHYPSLDQALAFSKYVSEIVTINGKTWIAENLAYKTKGAKTLNGSEKYGYAYQGKVIFKNDVCPTGWSLPTENEFKSRIII